MDRTARAAHAQFEQEYRAQFVRSFHFDSDAVLSLGPDARFARQDDGTTVMIEALLPLDVLPRVSEAPVRTLGVHVDSQATELPGSWQTVTFTEPVRFGFDTDVRERAEQFSSGTLPLTSSYHLGKDTIFLARYKDTWDRYSVVETQEPLATKVGQLGDLEILRLFLGKGYAIRRNELLVDLWQEDLGKLLHVVQRDNKLHLIHFQRFMDESSWRIEGEIAILTVDRQGNHERIELEYDEALPSRTWDEVEAVHSADWSTVGVVGKVSLDRQRQGNQEITTWLGGDLRWTWKKRSQRYELHRTPKGKWTTTKPVGP